MRVTSPFTNRKGEARISVSLTLGECAEYAPLLGASKTVSASFDAEAFARDIAPKLQRHGGVGAAQASDAGLTVDAPRESRKRVPRAPKVADAPPSADALVASVIAALDAREATRAKLATPAAPKPARKPRTKAAASS